MNKSRTFKIIKIIVIVIIVIIGNGYFIYNLVNNEDKKTIERNFKNINKEFNQIQKSDILKHKIIHVVPPELYGNAKTRTFLILNDNQKISIVSKENKLYELSYLSDYIKEQDSISKRRNSDTLFVFRNDEKKYFLLALFPDQRSI